ncbi:MAG: transglutaminase-like domain-containing protein [Acidimicrobiales bacterium]
MPEIGTRFAALVSGSEDELWARLDEAALLIAAAGQGHDSDWVASQLARLDEIAADCPPGLDGLVSHLFAGDEGSLGLSGDTDTYADPQNSYLDRVLDRRLGIPITLSVLAIVVGRRIGVELAGVGMPGHFLVRHEGQPRLLLDCFEGGRRLTSGDCQEILERITGGPLPGFDMAWLDPTPGRDIVVRMLTNLRQLALATADVALLGWVAPLRAAVPGVGDDDLRLLNALRAKLS